MTPLICKGYKIIKPDVTILKYDFQQNFRLSSDPHD